ncbi:MULTISPECIES: cyd operon protein YbgE [Pasteurellaceae]|uniref:Cyd operon protein YbgE n=1 Tax=Pasteurella atlantica TaxID=2827233 RepID=A0AAW8CN37_9PAST|nr:cyd operon protein YbgE [Pasteurella atlantica]MBR0572807.1 cyd operon protein YbgE [Pasteurella atlantica]MDP8038735.1 cyd operon protein YbgE [Pasteurella atlantica]MDP8040827.1 cyd operon protein YbgE [Pasteurella atlantica]MDP8043000.1 cyd operon protein YbgE [Pasteurella atlantica]MDP8045086.1 cyd operon protein YbgE [Pasteurella atlantica]
MVDKLYNLTSKGFLKALSFVFASLLFGLILFNSTTFSQQFGGKIPYLAILVFYGMTILWIHGIGFEIKSKIWKIVFLPLTGYVIVLSAIVLILVK